MISTETSAGEFWKVMSWIKENHISAKYYTSGKHDWWEFDNKHTETIFVLKFQHIIINKDLPNENFLTDVTV